LAGVGATEAAGEDFPTGAVKSSEAGIVPAPAAMHLHMYYRPSTWRHSQSIVFCAKAGNTNKTENNIRNMANHLPG
jgi:hypothetical protein